MDTDYGISIVVDGAGNAYISGSTNSTQDSFPVINGPDLTYNGGEYDAFIAKASIVPWVTYLPLVTAGD
jgi:Beta-propeller repeat